MAVRRDSTDNTEAVMTLAPVSGFAIVAQFVRTAQQPEVLGLQLAGIPHALLPAVGAVALSCALVEVDVRLERDCFAMAAAVIGAFHVSSLSHEGAASVVVPRQHMTMSDFCWHLARGVLLRN